MSKKKQAETPILKSLLDKSRLRKQVQAGLQALKSRHRDLIANEIRGEFADSIDIDEAFQAECPNDNRWDYLLGLRATKEIIGLEPHSANDKEIGVIIRKRKNAKTQLGNHLKPTGLVSSWFWVTSGRCDFTSLDKTTMRLNAEGIQFIGTCLLKSHLKVPRNPRSPSLKKR